MAKAVRKIVLHYSGAWFALAQKFTQICMIFIMIGASAACGPLPRPGALSADLGVLPISDDVTGLVMASVDSSYTSTDLFFYNLANGHLEMMLGGESGDVLTKWYGGQLWIFNRAAGRVSYSAMSPKVGVASRQMERRTPGAAANDPADVLWVHDDVAILAMQTSHLVAVARLKAGSVSADAPVSNLDPIDTQDATVPFRPGVLGFGGDDIAVFHQSLNTDWKAVGGGFVFLARQDDADRFSWADQNVVAPGIQGLRLNISNPVQTLNCRRDDRQCLVAGSCFESMGESCVGGIDLIDWDQRSVTSQMNWPSGSYAAGQVAVGFSSQQVVACLRFSGDSEAKLALFDTLTGSLIAHWTTGAPWCGPFIVDQSGKRIFTVQKIAGVSYLVELQASLEEKNRTRLGFDVMSLEAVNE